MGLLLGGSFYAFGLVFMFCEFGEQIKRRSDEINDAICDLDWNTFPLHVQRMMPVILLSVQNPVELTAYGGVRCARLTFKAASFNSFYN